jgi:nucleoside-diphosphate-sugar epimerase
MKIFLTGGTGFIGSHFIEQALAAGHDIVALRRPAAEPRIALSRSPVWVEGSLDGDHARHMAGVDIFVHLVAHTANVPYDTLERCLYWNVFASLNLADQARQQGVRNFLVAGTCFEYGRSAERVEAIPTDLPLEPTSAYPTSKAAASVAFEGFARQYGIGLKLLRIFQVYGEGESENRLWPALRKAAKEGKDFAMSPGDQLRDFVSVQEVADQFVRALDFGNVVPGKPMIQHVVGEGPQTLRQFAEHWWSQWGATGKLSLGAVPYRPNELMRLVSVR